MESQNYARKFELGLSFGGRLPDGWKDLFVSFDTVRAVLAEFLGMVIFVFNGFTASYRLALMVQQALVTGRCRSTVIKYVVTVTRSVERRDLMTDEGSATIVRIAFVVGISIFLLVYILGKVSGAHLNPAVSLALLVGKRIPAERFIVYVIVQVLGAMAGAGIATTVLGFSDDGYQATYDDFDVGDTFAGEVLCTFFFVMTIFASTDGELDRRHAFTEPLAPWTIGLVVLLAHLITIPLNGSINPAPSFGIAYINNGWEFHWIFWIGPLVGAIFATVVWETILRPDQLVDFQTSTVQAANV